MPFASCSRFACLGASILGLSVGFAQAADLAVSITGVRDSTQSVRVALYADADTFRHEKDAVQVLTIPAQEGTVSGVFHDIPAGRYAVLAYHDENGNQKLDLFLGMIPTEGWGLSNDPTVVGPPRFDASAFDIAESGGAVSVQLHY